jgi:hypothetical protein
MHRGADGELSRVKNRSTCQRKISSATSRWLASIRADSAGQLSLMVCGASAVHVGVDDAQALAFEARFHPCWAVHRKWLRPQRTKFAFLLGLISMAQACLTDQEAGVARFRLPHLHVPQESWW